MRMGAHERSRFLLLPSRAREVYLTLPAARQRRLLGLPPKKMEAEREYYDNRYGFAEDAQ